jgi:hypothetical protein
MSIVALKLTLTPMLICLASLASRRWGHTIGGWLVALPFTAGPVAFFLALEQGRRFAAAESLGSLAGILGEAGFCLAYGWSARRFRWPVSLMAGTIIFGTVAAILRPLGLRLAPVFLAVMLTLPAVLSLLPRGAPGPGSKPRGYWDLPFRMATATTIVMVLTGAAATLGPTLSGVFATFPVYASTLAIFAHDSNGWQAAVQVLRGLLYGLFGLAAFFAVLAALISHLALAVSFLAAIIVLLVVQGGSLWAIQRRA